MVSGPVVNRSPAVDFGLIVSLDLVGILGARRAPRLEMPRSPSAGQVSSFTGHHVAVVSRRQNARWNVAGHRAEALNKTLPVQLNRG